jgi:hypothetical protein
MIPYEELCDALARWRSRNGLANGPSAQVPPAAAVIPPSAPTSFETAHTDEHPGDGATTITANPLATDDVDAPTGLHQAAPERVPAETTNELSLDSVIESDEREPS